MADAARIRTAYIWWCGDDHCDCTQPVVEDKWQAPEGFWCFDRIWEGTFMTSGDGDRAVQHEELRKAAKDYGAISEEDDAAQPQPTPSGQMPSGRKE